MATIVFADVIGSTDLGEQLDPERLRALLAEYFGHMARVIETWGGTVEKYIGDAIVAVFGVPTAREDDAIRALNAARDMIAQLETLNAGFEERHGVRLGVRIGVNTGEVLAPSSARAGGQFLVSGDPVNVAARLEQAADPATVLVGERTWLAARSDFEFGEAAPLSLKGKREPVVARQLGNPVAGEARGVRFQAPMVGRERELQTLLGLLDEAVESSTPRLAVVAGPAGIGKSRLLREFIEEASERNPDVAVLRGRCLAAGRGITFWALGEILRSACRISLDEPSDSATQKLVATLDPLLAPLELGAAERDETVFALATSAGLAMADNPLGELEPERVGEAMARAWPRFVSALAQRAPLTLLVEDLHWADERMVAMLELIATRSSGPVLQLATARPEFLESHPGLAGGDLSVVALRPLNDAQSERLVAELLGESDALQALVAEVMQKADGNPFFLEEILQRLIDEGAITHEGGRWRPTARAAEIRLPDTIHGLLAARIDALPADEKAVLQQAAVVGRNFWPGSLAAVGAVATDALRALERRGLVSARPTSTVAGQVEYGFRHVLIRDVAYASVPKTRRARAHAETAAWIEQLAGDRLEEFGELLAYHYAAAAAGEDADLAWAGDAAERDRIRRRAFDASLSAGAVARRRFAVDKAIALHEQALELAADAAERARALEELADDHEAMFHMSEAVAKYFEAVEAVHSADADDDLTIGRLAAKVASASQRWGAFRTDPPVGPIRELIERAMTLELPDELRARLLIGYGGLATWAPRGSTRSPIREEDRKFLAASITATEEGLAIAERLNDPWLLYRANDVLASLYLHAGRFDGFREAVEREAVLVDALPSAREQVDSLTTISLARSAAGRYRLALEAAERAYKLGEGLSRHERMHASFALMVAAEKLGEWDRILEVLPWHMEAAAAEPDVTCPNVRGGPSLGATILVWRGERERAAQLVPVDERASERNTLADRGVAARYAALIGRNDVAAAIVERMAQSPDRVRYPEGFEEFFETLRLLGREHDVRAFLAPARELVPAETLLGPIADRAEGALELQAGHNVVAHALLKSAVGRFDELSVPFESAQARELLAEVSEPAEAREMLESALETYRQLGAAPFVTRVEGVLARLPDNVSLAGG